jgi:hypothetical protein
MKGLDDILTRIGERQLARGTYNPQTAPRGRKCVASSKGRWDLVECCVLLEHNGLRRWLAERAVAVTLRTPRSTVLMNANSMGTIQCKSIAKESVVIRMSGGEKRVETPPRWRDKDPWNSAGREGSFCVVATRAMHISSSRAFGRKVTLSVLRIAAPPKFERLMP